jgi:hypothetical protein
VLLGRLDLCKSKKSEGKEVSDSFDEVNILESRLGLS